MTLKRHVIRSLVWHGLRINWRKIYIDHDWCLAENPLSIEVLKYRSWGCTAIEQARETVYTYRGEVN